MLGARSALFPDRGLVPFLVRAPGGSLTTSMSLSSLAAFDLGCFFLAWVSGASSPALALPFLVFLVFLTVFSSSLSVESASSLRLGEVASLSSGSAAALCDFVEGFPCFVFDLGLGLLARGAGGGES